MIIVNDDVAVYHDGGGQSQYHFNQLSNVKFNEERHYYSGADSFVPFIQSKAKIKLAGFHVPFPDENDWVVRIKLMYERVDHIFIFCSELHRATCEQLKSLDKPKVSIFVNGTFNEPFEYAQVHPWMDWFCQPLFFYTEKQPNLLKEKLILGSKSKMFDVLLGAQREHRDFVHYFINASLNKNLYYKTYYHRIDMPLAWTGFDMDEDGLETIPDSKLNHSIDRVLYYGHELGISQIVPTKIYNQTNYSIIAETNAENDFSFPTEKITKPLMSGRLFVVIAGQYYLRNLRSFGFKTFDGVIDESYDTEPDPKQRWAMAMQQCEWLCQQNPTLILKQVESIVDHNKQLIFGHNWYKEFSSLFETEILKYIK